MSKELTLAKAVGKVADALGIEQTDTREAITDHEIESAIGVEMARHRRALLDLESEFVLRQGRVRRDHLRRMAEITNETE